MKPGIPLALIGGGSLFLATLVFLPASIATVGDPDEPDSPAFIGLTAIWLVLDAAGIILYSAGVSRWLVYRSRGAQGR